MNDNQKSKIDLITAQLSKLTNIKHDQQQLIESLAQVQLEMSESNEETLLEKVSEIFSNASNNQEILKKLVKDIEIELNQLKNEANG